MPISTNVAMRHARGTGGREMPCGPDSLLPRRDGNPCSHYFLVHEEPAVLVAGGMGVDHYAQLEVSPDDGATWVEVYIHSVPVRLTPNNSLMYLPIAGKYRLRYVGTPVGRITLTRSTLTHDAAVPLTEALDADFFLTNDAANSTYLKKADDIAENLRIYKPATQTTLVFDADADANDPFPGQGLGGIGFRMDDLPRFRLSYSTDAWGVHTFLDDGTKIDAFTIHRQSQTAQFYGNVSLNGFGAPTAFRGLAQLDIYGPTQRATLLQETANGAALSQVVMSGNVYLDLLTLTAAGSYAPAAGPHAEIRQMDDVGVVQSRFVFAPEGDIQVGGALVDKLVDATGATGLTLDFRRAGVQVVDAGSAVDDIISKAGQAMRIVVVGSGAITFTANVAYGVTLATGATWGTTSTIVDLLDTGGTPRTILAGTTPF